MKRILSAALLGLSVCIAGIAPARAALNASDIGQFQKFTTTLDQVVAKLGQPGRSERNEEGLKAIGYLAPDAKPDTKISLFEAAGKSSDPTIAAVFVFDRVGRLVRYRAQIKSSGAVTSEDGAGPLPNINAYITGQQSQASIAATPNDGKPRLGIQMIPTSQTDAKHQQQFAAAKFQGMIVVKLLPESVALRAGIRRDDYIYLLNGFLVASFDDVSKAMAEVKADQKIPIHVFRIDQDSDAVADQVFVLKF